MNQSIHYCKIDHLFANAYSGHINFFLLSSLNTSLFANNVFQLVLPSVLDSWSVVCKCIHLEHTYSIRYLLSYLDRGYQYHFDQFFIVFQCTLSGSSSFVFLRLLFIWLLQVLQSQSAPNNVHYNHILFLQVQIKVFQRGWCIVFSINNPVVYHAFLFRACYCFLI